MSNRILSGLYQFACRSAKAMRRYAWFFSLFICCNCYAQTYYSVTALSGTQSVGGNTVTVTPRDGTLSGYNACSISPYGIGNTTLSSPSSYKFSFATPVNRIRLQLAQGHDGEVLRFFINGNQYAINSGNISYFSSSCAASTMAPYTGNDLVITNSVLFGSSPVVNGQVSIVTNYPIDSVRVTHVNSIYDGLIFNFAFATDTIVYLKQPFNDTLFCAGDSLKLAFGVLNHFTGSNAFTAQLSNAAGSFSSPVTIGSFTGTDADTIRCRIPANTVSGSGYRVRVVANAPGNISGDNGANIRIKTLPQAAIATSNSPLCSGDTLKFTSSSSTANVSFSWSGPQSFLATTSNPYIANSSTSYSGNYIDTISLDGCKVIDTVVVLVKPMPNAPAPGSNAPICTGSILSLTATGTSGASYLWTGPPSYATSNQNPSRSGMTPIQGGMYYITVNLSGCLQKDSLFVVVNPPTQTPTIGSNTPVCASGNIDFTASTVPAATYLWTGPGGTWTSTSQNPSKQFVGLPDAGTYSVVARRNGCNSLPAYTTVAVIQGPYVSSTVAPGDSICPGASATFISVPQSPGPNPTFEWFKNGVSTGVTTANYTTAGINTGDKFYVEMKAPGVCNSAIKSNDNTMFVRPATAPPAAVIAADAGGNVWPGLNVTFSVITLVNGGTNPTYQWKLGGVDIGGATGSTYSTTALTDKDTICVYVTSSELCPSPPSTLSNCIGMNVSVGVNNVSAANDIQLYPNPTQGTFYLASPMASGSTGIFTISNMQGQQVASYNIDQAKTLIQLPNGISAGIYLCKLTGADGASHVTRLVVQ